jgi:hypothetical protein
LTTIYQPGVSRAIEARCERLTPATAALWGDMNVAQMLRHVARSLRTPTGELVPPLLPWPVRLIGRVVKRRVLSDAPLKKSAPTTPFFKVVEPCEFAAEKAEFLDALGKVSVGPHVATAPQHPFFGPMTAQDWGRLMYRHVDHHFKQFGV